MVHLAFKYSVNELPFLFWVPSKTYPLRKWSSVTDWQKQELTHKKKQTTTQKPKTLQFSIAELKIKKKR